MFPKIGGNIGRLLGLPKKNKEAKVGGKPKTEKTQAPDFAWNIKTKKSSQGSTEKLDKEGYEKRTEKNVKKDIKQVGARDPAKIEKSKRNKALMNVRNECMGVFNLGALPRKLMEMAGKTLARVLKNPDKLKDRKSIRNFRILGNALRKEGYKMEFGKGYVKLANTTSKEGFILFNNGAKYVGSFDGYKATGMGTLYNKSGTAVVYEKGNFYKEDSKNGPVSSFKDVNNFFDVMGVGPKTFFGKMGKLVENLWNNLNIAKPFPR
ncbi:hypothetical protein ACFLZV_01350 [Candidatus Margulisiibacteriota bacterium]